MSDWVPKNKAQAEGYEIGKTFVQEFTDQIKAKDARIKELLDFVSACRFAGRDGLETLKSEAQRLYAQR